MRWLQRSTSQPCRSDAEHRNEDKRVNDNFRGTWLNAQNINKTEAEIIALWDADNPTNLIEQ